MLLMMRWAQSTDPRDKVLYVLRRKGKYYRFIGECYVFGLMNGEALEELEERREDYFHFI
jgi:hypothetical protein